nr:hypothetical protein [Kofleriaceae bacterium]
CQMAGDPPNAPVCGADRACRACTQHSECASEVCLPTGACAVAMDVAYVDGTGGTDAGTCAQGAACKTITTALTKAKGIIKVTNTVNDQVTVLNRNVQIFAGTNSKLTSTSNGALFTTSGTSVVELYDLAIADASGTSTGFGIQVGANTTVKMTRGKVSGCREAGITSSGGTVTVTGATVTANNGGGVLVMNGVFKLDNNIISSNGNGSATGSDFGGVQLSSNMSGNSFTQNTIVYNHQKAGAFGGPGVNCAVTGFAGARNIVSANDTGTVFATQTGGGCTYGDSFISAGSAANTLGFANIAGLDFHLTAASPAGAGMVRDVPGVVCTGTKDIDGEARPKNGACDLGADEF